MYTVQQLQALDYLLKKITNTSSYALYQRNLKLVIEFNNSLWYGDFVQMDGNSVQQLFIEDDGDIDLVRIKTTGSNATSMFKKIWDSYSSSVGLDGSKRFWINPFNNLDNIPLLFESLLKILELAELSDIPSPLHPYLLNAHSLDGTSNLTFINLSGAQIKLVSIIEVKN